MNERNHWMTFPNSFIVRWGAFLPGPRGEVGPLARFGAGVVDAGSRHDVFRVVRLPAAYPFEAGRLSYEDYLRDQARQRGRIPLFPQSGRPGPDLWTPARLAFYRSDTVVEEEVGDVGALLQELRPGKLETSLMFMRSASPVTIDGISVALDETSDVRIQVRLDTDIWFPRVMGMLEDIPEDEEKPDWYDNRELACRHTPRLNAFLAEVRQLALELGGRWETLEVDDVAVNYADQWDASGIRLDPAGDVDR